MSSKKDYIYNFFKFLEEKEGKFLKGLEKFNFKLKYESETLTKEDFKKNTTGDLEYIERLIEYRPELVTPEDVNSVDNTQGIRLQLKMKYFPNIIKPEDLEMNVLILRDPDIKFLPKGITVNRMYIYKDSGLEKLPENLTCEALTIEGTKIKNLPKDLKVIKSLELPYSFPGEVPEYLESVVNFPYGVTRKLRNLFKDSKDFNIKLGNKTITARGIEITPDQVENLIITLYRPTNSKLVDLVRKGSEMGVKWDKVFLQTFTGDKYHIPWYILGKDKKGRELVWTSENEIVTAEAKVSVKSFDIHRFSQALWDKMQSKLFPKSEESKPKAIGIRKLLGTQGKPVGWKIGRKTRGGEVGISGQAKDLIYSLSSPSQNNLIKAAEDHKVEWGDMIIFENQDSINFIVRSKKPYKGSEYLYLDKTGYGLGGSTGVFVGPDYMKIR